MGKALIVYVTRKGATRAIADLIAEGIRISGHEARVTEAAAVREEADLRGYDAYVLGSATYHGDMMQGMKTLLFLAEKTGLAGKAGGAFGSYGWSGEAPGRIFDTMKHVLGMEVVGGPLMLKSAAMGGGTRMAQDYGRQIGDKMAATA